MKLLLLACMVAGLICGCEEVDNQLILPVDRWQAANPEPVVRDFVQINNNHKLLMAVIDTGTDYNHPELLANMHFDLDAAGKPVGFGYDYTGQDRWAAPYVGRSLDLDGQAPLDGITRSGLAFARLTKFQAELPQIARFLDPRREVFQEAVQGPLHGTHVSGLMVYDDLRLGLIGYRVLPINTVYKEQSQVSVDKAQVIYDGIMAALNDAATRGVKVVNMSLGLTQDISDSTSEQMEIFRKKVAVLREFALNNPQMIIVVAAGNSSAWVDGDRRLQLPCGTSAPNIVCVGALHTDGDIASFSNILITEGAFVLAPGTSIYSTVPTNICRFNDYYFLDKADGEYPFNSAEETKKYVDKLVQTCSAENGFAAMSGTSMASPIIAHKVAQVLLENPAFSGAEAINYLLEHSESSRVGTLSFKKIRVIKPSWYARLNVGQADVWIKPPALLKDGAEDNDFSFDAIGIVKK